MLWFNLTILFLTVSCRLESRSRVGILNLGFTDSIGSVNRIQGVCELWMGKKITSLTLWFSTGVILFLFFFFFYHPLACLTLSRDILVVTTRWVSAIGITLTEARDISKDPTVYRGRTPNNKELSSSKCQ